MTEYKAKLETLIRLAKEDKAKYKNSTLSGYYDGKLVGLEMAMTSLNLSQTSHSKKG